MSHEEMNGPNDAEFEPTLRESFRDLIRRRATCPDTGELTRYYTGELSEERANQVKNHVEVCGVCDLLLESLRRFDQAARSDSPDIPAARWGDVDQRLTKRMETFLKSHPTSTTRPATASKKGTIRTTLQAMGSFLRRPAVGYVIALILSYPAYLGITSKGPTILFEARRRIGVSQSQSSKAPVPPLGAQPAPVLELNAVRGASKLFERVQLADRDKVFVLSFFVPVRSARRYTAIILNDTGIAIAGEQDLPEQKDGNFVLVCARESFRPGEYSLIVQELDRQSGQVLRKIVFRFQV